jgi:hypothetical protein
MARVPGVTPHDHPLNQLKPGSPPPKPPMPKASKVKKSRKRPTKRKAK